MENLSHYKLTVETRDSYVFARIRGDDPITEGPAQYLGVIADRCVRNRCEAILIEKYTPEVFEVWKAFSVAPKLARTGRRSLKVAIVERCAKAPVKRDLTIKIGSDRSLSVNVFTETAAAEDWLALAA